MINLTSYYLRTEWKFFFLVYFYGFILKVSEQKCTPNFSLAITIIIMLHDTYKIYYTDIFICGYNVYMCTVA